MDYLKTRAPFWKKEAHRGRRALGRRARSRRRGGGARLGKADALLRRPVEFPPGVPHLWGIENPAARTPHAFRQTTTKFQQALADAQSLAVGHDNQFIEPQHLLLALLQQDDGGTALAAGARRRQCAGAQDGAEQAIDRLPKVEGHGGEVQHRPRSDQPAQPHRQGSAEARRPVHRLRDVPARAVRRQGRSRAPGQAARPGDARRWSRRSAPCAAGRASIRRKPKASARR